ncbi:MAG: hypothetical protein AAGF48_13035 [Pseudomonadota bacterium]
MQTQQYDVPAFDPSAHGTPNPAWTKERLGRRTSNSFDRLAQHICSRTPPGSYGSKTALFMEIVCRNQSAIGSWDRGYEILTDKVAALLIQRDGEL